MDLKKKLLHQVTRRQLFADCGVGVGKVALASMLAGDQVFAAPKAEAATGFHHTPKAKNVIYLFMAGAPSQFELWERKPELQKLSGQPMPPSLMEGKRFAFMDSFAKAAPKLLGTRREFKQHGQSGQWVSECMPHTAQVVDDLTFIRSVHTENFNHAPAKIMMNTGSPIFGRPSMGAWVSYGIGSESKELPGFVVLQSGPRGPRGGALNWASGFLPTAHQGVPFLSGGAPILNMANPPGFDARRQSETIDAVVDLDRMNLDRFGDPEIETRIAAYEMAHRMQTSGPELIDFAQESQETLDMYGAVPGEKSFANNCLLARRLIERGVRFVQLFHRGWDQHDNLKTQLTNQCRDTDQPTAALVNDLKQRGLLDETLVIWGGEFGRTAYSQGALGNGRDHHGRCFSVWMAGGGVKPGIEHGATDDYCYNIASGGVHIHDLNATILHCLGIDHERLTFRFQGLDQRLTGVETHAPVFDVLA